MRCFLIEEPKQEYNVYELLANFGDVVTLFKSNERRPPIFLGQQYCAEIFELLKQHNFDGAEDCFVVVGPIIPIVLVTLVLAEAVPKTLKLLVYNATIRNYQMIELDMVNLIPDEELVGRH